MIRENVGLLLTGAGDLVTNDMEDTKILTAFFTSVFTGKICLQESQASEASGKILSKEDLPWAEEDQVREHLK